MKSIGILRYGTFDDNVFKINFDALVKKYNINFKPYEVVIREPDLESRQKTGNWVNQSISEYLEKLSPVTYNLYLDAYEKKPVTEQNLELLKYLYSKDGLLILVLSSDISLATIQGFDQDLETGVIYVRYNNPFIPLPKGYTLKITLDTASANGALVMTHPNTMSMKGQVNSISGILSVEIEERDTITIPEMELIQKLTAIIMVI